MAAKIRVMIVDDHPFVREGLRFFLHQSAQFEVIGEASNAQEALAQVHVLRPDVVVMDFRLPGMDGIEATRRLRAALPSTVVLLLSVEQNEDLQERARAAGAAAWITKDTPPGQLLAKLQSVSNSEV